MRKLHFLSLLTLAAFAATAFVALPANAEDVPVPQNSGFFVYDGGKLMEIGKQYVKRKEIEVGKNGKKKQFLGFSDDGIDWTKVSSKAEFVLYDARVPHNEPNFRTLKFEGKRGNMKSELWQLNMWVRDKKVPVKLREHPKKSGVWIFSPDTPNGQWAKGRHCVYFGDSMRKARKADYPAVFNWEVK